MKMNTTDGGFTSGSTWNGFLSYAAAVDVDKTGGCWVVLGKTNPMITHVAARARHTQTISRLFDCLRTRRMPLP
jgi:hypothetical protein